jgi:hypothetical protein
MSPAPVEIGCRKTQKLGVLGMVTSIKKTARSTAVNFFGAIIRDRQSPDIAEYGQAILASHRSLEKAGPERTKW